MKKLLILITIICLIGCSEKATIDYDTINDFDYDDVTELTYSIHSNEYMLVRMSDFKVLNSKDADKIIYPASLTKLMTLDAVLHYVSDLNVTSSISQEQVQELIDEDASIAYLKTDYNYSIRDLLYALILPSGADAAVALENYFAKNGTSLIEQMNLLLLQLECEDTNFVNTTGLHDDSHHTTLNDLLKITMDILKNDEGRKILESMSYTCDDGLTLYSSLRKIKPSQADVLGGKTGYTEESGQSVMVLFKKNNRSYILFVANAYGDYSLDQYWHYTDAMEIINKI